MYVYARNNVTYTGISNVNIKQRLFILKVKQMLAKYCIPMRAL